MKQSSQIVHGNYENKYESQNAIHKFLMDRFLQTFDSLISSIPTPKTILEVGAGEGYLTERLQITFPQAKIHASDISSQIIVDAQKRNPQLKKVVWDTEDVHELKYSDNSFDLVVCCEVLEHVEMPIRVLSELKRVSSQYILMSVPQEPIWRILNLSRGKYVTQLGNTPGHINHWTPAQFNELILEAGLEGIQKRYPFPWTMTLALNVSQ